MHCHEYLDVHLKSGNILSDIGQIWPVHGVGEHVDDVYRRIGEYFPRQLSFGSDSLNAIEGILQAFDSTRFPTIRATHLYGIPIIYNIATPTDLQSEFAKALLWKVVSRTNRESTRSRLCSPSWSWVTSKATTRDTTDMYFYRMPCFGLSHQGDIRFRIVHLDGRAVDLSELTMLSQPTNYAKSYPWIEIETWTMRTVRESVDAYRFGNYYETAMADAPETYAWGHHEVIALYMGATAAGIMAHSAYYTVFLLLVREHPPGTSRRFGTSQIGLPNVSKRNLSTEDILSEILEHRKIGPTGVWKKETLLIE
jgi:hypothetical protein